MIPLFSLKIGGDDKKYIDDPTALIIEKTTRLKHLKSPKLILLGGSSSFFGIDSNKLQDDLEMNVVNMAQFAGFGLKFMLQQTKGNTKEGDIVLLNFEYFLKLNMRSEVEEKIKRFHPESATLINGESTTFTENLIYNFQNNIESIATILIRSMIKESDTYKFSRTANEYGDNIGYLPYENEANRSKMKKTDYRYYEGIQLIKNYLKDIENNGGDGFIMFPPISEYASNLNKDVYEKYYRDFKIAFGNRVICSPYQMVFADSLFFDSPYHLNAYGRKLRTERMIEIMKDKVFISSDLNPIGN